MAKSNYLEESVLNHVLRGVAFPTLPANVFAALFTANPAEDASGAEVTGGSYARVQISRAAGSWTAPSQGADAAEVENVDPFTFPAPTASWGTVTHVGLMDALTAGNLLYYGALTTPRVVPSGAEPPEFAAGQFLVREA
jgi:hypothetical protein